jgi:hypothetical protein
LADFKKKAKYQIHSVVRGHARAVFKETGLPSACSICGYSRHVELHHIKSIGLFANEAKGSEINSLLNLSVLCPNHHWEADHGFVQPVSLAALLTKTAA